MTATIIISRNKSKWVSLFHPKLIFSTLTDEHILRLLFLQKIKISSNVNDNIKIYLDNIQLDDCTISYKLSCILKYHSSSYNIEILDIEDGYDINEIAEYTKLIYEIHK